MLKNDTIDSPGNGQFRTLDAATPDMGSDRTVAVYPAQYPAALYPSAASPDAEALFAAIFIPPGGNREIVYQAIKRGLDVIGSLALLVALSPILLGTFLVLCVTTKGRPIYVQPRVGRCGRLFRMFKFRTMCLDADVRQKVVANEMDGPVFKNRRDPRVTPLGRVLRQLSIDELPQLVNVLWGEMSLVGPRPPILAEVLKYEPWQRERLSVKPGLTCLWQVSGRNEIGFEDWMRMDIWYVENQNLLTDLKLLVLTPWVVVCRKGAY
jgi:lipopolysaccharide/colanic/teichoic acid biosynthesis glycosyltransferase